MKNIFENGIYVIYHEDKPNIYYVGSVFRNGIKQSAKGFNSRWREHKIFLRKNKHHSKYLQRVVNKYGIEKLKFEIVEIMYDKDNIKDRETFYIQKFNSFHNGYNSTEQAEKVNVMSIEQREKHSARMKINNPMKNKETCKKVSDYRSQMMSKEIQQFSLDGTYLNTFKNSGDAATLNKVDASNINRAANGKSKSSANSLWIFSEDYTEELLEDKINIINKGRVFSEEEILKRKDVGNKAIEVFTIEGEKIDEFKSIDVAAKYYKIDPSTISRCCNGKTKTCNHKVFKFKSCGYSAC